MNRRLIAIASFVALLGTIFAANWALQTYGIIPIGFGLMAPAGVLFAGLAFGLRDVLHETAGHWEFGPDGQAHYVGARRWVLLAIVLGAAVSYLAAPSFAVPSAVAFLFSETADFLVYDPLRTRDWRWAVGLSNLAGAIVDSALFLWLAFGSLDFMVGQVVGKTYMTALALPIVWLVRQRTVQKPTAVAA